MLNFHLTCLVLSLQPRGGGEGQELLSALADCLFVHPVEYPRTQGHIRVGGGGILRATNRDSSDKAASEIISARKHSVNNLGMFFSKMNRATSH